MATLSGMWPLDHLCVFVVLSVLKIENLFSAMPVCFQLLQCCNVVIRRSFNVVRERGTDAGAAGCQRAQDRRVAVHSE